MKDFVSIYIERFLVIVIQLKLDRFYDFLFNPLFFWNLAFLYLNLNFLK